MEAVPGRTIASVPPWSDSIDLALANQTRLSTDSFDERAAVKAVIDGDRDAFRVLVERESPVVVRACYRILGDRADAEDAAQEAFVIAYRSIAAWRGEGPFGAWLARIAVRVALRQAGRRRSVEWADPERLGDSETAVGVTGTGPAGDPATMAVRAERSADLRRAVAQLDEPYRETLALRFFAEQSLAEIADATGRPLGTVKTHLRRGLLRLRDTLGEREADQ
jgi:RNA polymerase sigma-70 factor (ECF subfamily)